MRIGELNMEAVGIIGNHPREALNLTLMEGIPYHHLPVTKETKAAQEAEVRRIVEESGAELVVLARYMQVLSDELSAFLPAAASISIIPSCPASRVPSPIIRPMRAA